MKFRLSAKRLAAMGGVLAAGLVICSLVIGVSEAQTAERYSATVVPLEGYAGATTRILVRVTSYTTDEERKQLLEAFKKDNQDEGLALLRKMSKGYVNVEEKPGRKILAAFSRPGSDGRRLVLITERVLSQYERNQGVSAQNYPFTILHLQFDAQGNPVNGEVFPGARFKVTEDGFVDVETQTKSTGKVINIARQD